MYTDKRVICGNIFQGNTHCLIFISAPHSVPSNYYYYFFLPVSSSRISTSVVFRSSRTRAGMPPQFLRAILLSSLALPYTRFLRAPQALRCTSVIRWSNKSTSSWMPPWRLIWGQMKALRGQNGDIHKLLKCLLASRYAQWYLCTLCNI